MNEQQFKEACKQANRSLKSYEAIEALEAIKERRPIPSDVATKLYDAMEEYCEDNDLPEGAWLEWGDEEDVFFHYEDAMYNYNTED